MAVVALAAGCLLGGASVAAAQIYHYIDQDGVLHFTNVPTDSRFRPFVTGKSRVDVATPSVKRSTVERLAGATAAEQGVNPNLVKAVIKVESDFDAFAVSAAGAQGLMQLMPETAERMDVMDPFDPAANISAGVRHLRELLDRFDGNLPLALAAYNAGPLRVEAAGGIPRIDETRRYVQKVLTYYHDYERHAARPVRRTMDSNGVILLTNSPSRSPLTAQ